MAKKKVGKLTAEYRKARASLLRKISRYEQAGYDVKGAVFTAPPIPEKITRGSIKKMREQSAEKTKLRRQGKAGDYPEYSKARASLLRKIRRYKEMGYDVNGEVFTVSPIPIKITRESIDELRRQSAEITKLRKQGKIPVNGDLYLIKVFEDIIYEALKYADPYGRKANTMRVRHRAWESAVGADEAEIAHNAAVRIVANRNIGRTWPDLVERIESFIYDSDQYGYDGDLMELQKIFTDLVDKKGGEWSAEDEEQMAKYYTYGNDGNALIKMPWHMIVQTAFDWAALSESYSFK